MSGTTLRVLLVAVLVLVAFTALVGAAYAQDATPTVTTTVTSTVTAPATTAAGGAAATPGVLPTTGGSGMATNTATVVLLALGATAGLAGLLLRGLRRPL